VLEESPRRTFPALQKKDFGDSEKSTRFPKSREDDVLQFCKDVKPVGGRILGCLKEHQAELSTECRDVMSRPKKKK